MGNLTDSEFSWQHPFVRKPVFTKLTNHGVWPVQKRAPSSVAQEPQEVGDLTVALTLQEQYPVS